jgi:hypothetical protein
MEENVMTTIISYNDYLSSKKEGLSFNEIINKYEKHRYDKIKNTGITIANNKTFVSLVGLGLIMTLQLVTDQPTNTNTVKFLIREPDDLTDLSNIVGLGEFFFLCTNIWMLIL